MNRTDAYNDLITRAAEEGAPPGTTPGTVKVSGPEYVAAAHFICEEYRQAGFSLTLRQLYYQFVARGLLPNGDKFYKKIGNLIAKARVAGDFPMHFIEDRGRTVGLTDSITDKDNVEEALDLAAAQIRSMPYWNLSRARWLGQPVIVSVWIEKEALAGVFSPTCRNLGVGCFPCKGYPSVSSLYQWLRDAADSTEHDPEVAVVIAYFGDHDPDGFQIPRSALATMNEMLANGVIPGRCPSGQTWNAKEENAEPLTIRMDRKALSMEQIEEFNPPPFPAKVTSARYAGYVEEHGTEDAWELDALNPETLQGLIEEAVEENFDHDILQNNADEIHVLQREMRTRMQDTGWMENVW